MFNQFSSVFMEIFQVSRTGHYPTILIYGDNDYDATDQLMNDCNLSLGKQERVYLIVRG